MRWKILAVKKENPGRIGRGSHLARSYTWVGPDSPRPGTNFTGQYILSRGCENDYTQVSLLIYDKLVIYL